MTNGIAAYKKDLKRSLSRELCSRQTRTGLLEKFDKLLGRFQEEHPEPSPAEVSDAFGEPAYMAETLLEGLSPAERAQSKRISHTRRVVCIAALAVLVIGLTAGLVYAWCFKEFSIHTAETLIIYK